MGKRISELTAFIGTLLDAALIEISQGGASYKLTMAQLWAYMRTKISANQGSMEFTLTEGMLSTGNTTDGFATFTHADLIGLVNIELIFINSDKINRTERTYNSGAGTITLSAVKFYPTQVVYIQFKKA